MAPERRSASPTDDRKTDDAAKRSDSSDRSKRRRDKKSASKSPSPKRSRRDDGGKRNDEHADKKADPPPAPVPAKAAEPEVLTGRTGGAYIPPAKLRMMQQSITDKSSVAFQVSDANRNLFSKAHQSPILQTKIFTSQPTSLSAWCRASRQVYVLFYKISVGLVGSKPTSL
jgi:hypothetical protein